MQMRHRLPALFSAINDETIALRQTELLRQLDRDQVQVSDKLSIDLAQVSVCRDHLFGNNQNMDRRLGIDVVKSETKIVFIGDLCRDFLFDDLQEKVVGHHGRMFPG